MSEGATKKRKGHQGECTALCPTGGPPRYCNSQRANMRNTHTHTHTHTHVHTHKYTHAHTQKTYLVALPDGTANVEEKPPALGARTVGEQCLQHAQPGAEILREIRRAGFALLMHCGRLWIVTRPPRRLAWSLRRLVLRVVAHVRARARVKRRLALALASAARRARGRFGLCRAAWIRVVPLATPGFKVGGTAATPDRVSSQVVHTHTRSGSEHTQDRTQGLQLVSGCIGTPAIRAGLLSLAALGIAVIEGRLCGFGAKNFVLCYLLDLRQH